MKATVDGFKQVLGRFASGVTVVTVNNSENQVHGITVSAFISVSMEPMLVLVSIDKGARAHAMLESNEDFGVSILSSKQAGISNHFANWGEKAKPEFEKLGNVQVIKGALAQLHCSKYNQYDAGDHSLFIGKVENLDYSDTKPLVFYSGKYRKLKK